MIRPASTQNTWRSPLRGRLAALALVLALAGSLHARAAAWEADDLKAVLIGKIVSFIKWPAEAGLDDPERPFELAILGQTPLEPVLYRLYRDVRMANHRVFVRRVRSIGDIGRPHLLFLGRVSESDLKSALAALKTSPVLTVADTEGFADRGVAVNLYREADRIRFEISRAALQRHRLSAGYQLLNFARLVDPDR